MVLHGFLSWLIPRHKSCWRIALTLRRAFSSPLPSIPLVFLIILKLRRGSPKVSRKLALLLQVWSVLAFLFWSSFVVVLFFPLWVAEYVFTACGSCRQLSGGANGPKNRHRKEGRGCYFNFLWQCQQRAEHKSGGGCRSFGIARFPDLSVTQVLFNGFSKLLWRTGQTISGMSLKQFNLSPLFVTPCDMQFRRPAWRQANDMMCRSVGGQLIQRPSMPAVSHARLLFNK